MWSILWNIIKASLGYILVTLLLIILYTFTNPVQIFFLLVSWTSSLLFTFLITEWVYLDEEFSVMSLVDCRALNYLMKSCSSDDNVLTSIDIPWAPSISSDTTTNASSSEFRQVGLPNLIFWTDILVIFNNFDIETSPLFKVWCMFWAVMYWRGGHISFYHKIHLTGPESDM